MRAGAGEGDGEFYPDGREGEDAWLALHGADEIGGGDDVDFGAEGQEEGVDWGGVALSGGGEICEYVFITVRLGCGKEGGGEDVCTVDGRNIVFSAISSR